MSRKSTNTPKPQAAASIRHYDEDKYRAQDALRTLTRADEIRGDKALMRDVKKEAKSQIKTVGRVLTPSKRKG